MKTLQNIDQKQKNMCAQKHIYVKISNRYNLK